MEHERIINNLLKYCKKSEYPIGKAMNIVQNRVKELIFVDREGVKRFFIKINEEAEISEGEDFRLINGVYFDWKQFNDTNMLNEFIKLAFSCMSNEESRNKLKVILENLNRR